MDTNTKTPWSVMIEHYAERMKDLKKHEELDPLSVDERIELKIELSWGGPGDGFKLYLDKITREPVEGTITILTGLLMRSSHWKTMNLQ
jgi:hypothetical protein